MTDLEIVDKAIEVLRTRGWWQGDYEHTLVKGTDGPVCMLGAINIAIGSPAISEASESTAVYREARRLIDCDSVAGWNDRNGRTVEEVIGLLERVRERLVGA